MTGFDDEWAATPFHKKLGAFPRRHPFVVKAVLGLVIFDIGADPKHAMALLERLGYQKFETEVGDEEIGIVTIAWQPPPEDF